MEISKPLFISLQLALSFLSSNAISLAQIPQQYPQQFGSCNQTAMIFYPVQMGADGQQAIYTKGGYRLVIPGLGIAPNASQIAVYRDPQNNFWYVDKNGNPTPVSTQQMQNIMSQIQTQSLQRGQVQYGQYPQGMSQPNTYAQPTAPAAAAPVAPAQSQQNNNNGSSAMVTGLAAAGGAAMGSMITNSMYNNNNSTYGGVPYGAPIYRQPNGQYYYNDQGGKAVYVAPNSTNAAAYSEYDKQPSAYSGQQAQSTYQQQQNEQKATKQQNEQKAQSDYSQQQSQTQQKQQKAEQVAKQEKDSGRRGHRKEQESSLGESSQTNEKKRGHLRKSETSNGNLERGSQTLQGGGASRPSQRLR